MGVSAFSVLTAVAWFHAAALLVVLLRPRSAFLVRRGPSFLLALFFLGALRAVLPLDLPVSHVVQSWHVLPAVYAALSADFAPGAAHASIGGVLLVIWSVGCMIALCALGRRLYREKRYRDGLAVADSPQITRVLDRLHAPAVSVHVSGAIDSPMVIGLLRPHIYLPDLACSDAELEMILCHELQHFRTRDTWVQLFFLLLGAIFWWNPLFYLFRRELDRLLELRCDERTTAAWSTEQKEAYLSSILSVIKQSPATVHAFACASGLTCAGSSHFLRQRFELVLAERPKKGPRHIAAFSLLIAAFLLSFLVIVQPAGSPPEGEGGIVITPANAYIVMEGDVWKLYVDGEYSWDVSAEEADKEPFLGLSIIERGR